MMRFFGGVVLALIVGTLGMAQYFYAFYYDRSGGQDLVISVLNTMPDSNAVSISVYDAYGKSLWTISDTLAALTSRYLRLGQFVPEGQFHWGLVSLESTEPVVIGLEYLKDEKLISVDHVSQPVPELAEGEPYWLGAYYNQVGEDSAGIIVMNPWNEETGYVITIYRQDGAVLYKEEGLLDPHEADYYNLDKLLGHGSYLWGLVDVRMQGKAVVIAAEYYGLGLEVDNVTEFYY